MPDSNLPETLSWYRESGKWTIGLSSASLLAAAGGVEKVQKGPWFFQLIFAVFVIVSMASLFCAGLYYFALTNYGNTYERAQRIWKQRAARGDFNPAALETDAAVATVDTPAELQEVATTYRGDIQRYRKWHSRTIGWLVANIVLVPTVLVGALFGSTAPPPASGKPPVPHYSIAVSGSHRGADGKMHVHTFLLSENTGEVWQMICRGPDRVEFVRVPVEDLAIPSTKAPPLAVP
jgi:hypothetical protein